MFSPQIEYFRNKLEIPVETLEGVQAEYHDFAFSVSGMARADLVADTKLLIERAIKQGQDFEDFKRLFYRLIGRKGWLPKANPTAPLTEKEVKRTDRRIYTIIDTNHRRSFAAGRLQQMRDPQLLKTRPYWQWLWRDSPNPRPHHQAIDRKVFLATEDFWEHVYPQCGYGCRCGVRSLSVDDMKRLNLSVSKPPDWKKFIEPGFNRSAGTAPKKDRAEFIKQGLSRQPEGLKRKLKQELNQFFQS